MAGKNETDLIIQLRAEQQKFANQLKSAEARFNSFSNRIKKTAVTVGASLGIAFGGYAAANQIGNSIQKIANFEFQMDKVAAVSRATSNEIEQLSKNALDLGARSQFTATEIGKLQEELARLGFGTDMIVNMTDASRKLAQVADEELGASAKAVGQIINAFGFEAAQATRVANTMSESFAKSALNLEEFTVGMSYAAAAGKSAGFTLEQVTAMLGALVDSGIQGSKAGTALRDIFADLDIKGISLNTALEMINKSTNKNKTAFDLFGKVSMNAAVILAEQQDKVNKLTGELSDQNMELNSMVDVMEDNLLTDWKLFTSAIDGVIMKGGEANDTLRTIVQTMTDLVGVIDKAVYGLKILTDIRPGGGDFISGEIEKLFQGPTFSGDFGPEALAGGFDDLTDSLKKLGGESKTIGTDIEQIVNPLDKIKTSINDVKISIDELMDPWEKWKEEMGALHDAFNMTFDVPEEMADRIDEAITKPILEASEKAKKHIEDLNQILANGVVDGISSFAEGLGSGGLDQAFSGLFEVIGSGLQTLGKSLIAFGVSMKAFKEALTKNPVVAIAAGAAAIAMGALVKGAASSMSNVSSSGGSASSSGGGFSGGGLSGQSLSLNLKIDGKIKGSDIVFMVEREQVRLSRTRAA